MQPATHVHILWFRLGESLVDVKPAPTMVEDMADLTAYFRDLMRKDAGAFACTVELQGFAPVRVEFRALCQTVALVALPPHTTKEKVPDVLGLLVNGLEGPEDVAAVKSQVAFPPAVWKGVAEAPKPVAVFASNINGRMRDPATVTILHVLANVYFNQFGTNVVGAEGR